MSASNSIDSISSSRNFEPKETTTCTVQCGSLVVVIGVILLIGSLVATGCLYSRLGYSSFAIGGGGVAVLILSLVLKKYCLPEEITNEKIPTPPKKAQIPVITPPPTALPSAHVTLNDSQSSLTDFERDEIDPDELESESDPYDPTLLPPVPSVTAAPTPSVPQVVAPPKPPLPFIFNLVLDATHPLQHPIGIEPFIKRAPDARTMIMSAFIAGGLDNLSKIGMISFDEIVNIPLQFWLDDSMDFYSRVKNDPTRAHLKTIIDARMEALETTIQLKERLVRLNYPRLTVEDLFPAWKNSSLQFKLMMEDELASLNVASLARKDAKQLQDPFLLQLLKDQAQKRTGPVITPTTQEEMQDVLLVDLPRFTATQINAAPALFPPLTFLVMPESELAQLDTSKLLTAQLEQIFSVTYLLHVFKPEQVNACASQVQNKELFKNLSEVQALGFEESLLGPEIFKAIYSGPNAAKYLPKKDIKWIYARQSWFSNDHWRQIGPAHSAAIDLEMIDISKRQTVFRFVYSTDGNPSNAALRLPKEDLTWIYAHQSWFSDDHWRHIGPVHSAAIDLELIDEKTRKEVFHALYSPNIPFGGQSYENPSKAEVLLPQKPLTWIYKYHSWFLDSHWQSIGQAHAFAIDFEQIDQFTRKHVFNTLYSPFGDPSKAAEFLPKKSLTWIYKYHSWFLDSHWLSIGQAHAFAIDFEQIDQFTRKHVFNTLYSPFGDPSKAAEFLPKKSLTWIYKYHSWFLDSHWKQIGEAHILGLDIMQIDEHSRRHLCGILFSPFGKDPDAAKYLPRMSANQKANLRPYLSDKALQYL